MTLAELIAWQVPVQRYIIDHGILVPQTKLVLFGRYETWKSMLVLDIVYHVANGLPWLGFKTSKTPTYVVQSEIPQAELRDRTIKYCMGNSLKSESVWFASEPYTKLDKGPGMVELDKELTRTNAKLVVFDPLYKFMSGRLVDEYDMRIFMDRMDLLVIDKHKATLIIVHHPRKTIISEGQPLTMGGDDVFGSFLQNWASTIIRTETNGIDDKLTLIFEKVRHNHLDRLMPITVDVDRNTLKFNRV